MRYWEMHDHAHLSSGTSKIAFCPAPEGREGLFSWHCPSLVILLLGCYHPKYILGPREGNRWGCAPRAGGTASFPTGAVVPCCCGHY